MKIIHVRYFGGNILNSDDFMAHSVFCSYSVGVFSSKWRNLHTGHFSNEKYPFQIASQSLEKILELILCGIVVVKKIIRGISGFSFYGEKCLKTKFITNSALFVFVLFCFFSVKSVFFFSLRIFNFFMFFGRFAYFLY